VQVIQRPNLVSRGDTPATHASPFDPLAEPKGLSAPAGKKRVKVEKPAPVTRSEVRGVIPRAVLGGNPLQMFNPRAPAKYGTAEQSLAYNPFTGKYDQIKLVEIVF